MHFGETITYSNIINISTGAPPAGVLMFVDKIIISFDFHQSISLTLYVLIISVFVIGYMYNKYQSKRQYLHSAAEFIEKDWHGEKFLTTISKKPFTIGLVSIILISLSN